MKRSTQLWALALCGLMLVMGGGCGTTTTSGNTTRPLEPRASVLVIELYADETLADQLARAATLVESAARPKLVVIAQIVGDGVRPRTYTVKSGDAVCLVAERYELACADVIRANAWLTTNGRTPNLIRPGEVLAIPVPGQPATTLIAAAAPAGPPRPTRRQVNPLPAHPTPVQVKQHQQQEQDADDQLKRDTDLWSSNTANALRPWISDVTTQLLALASEPAILQAIAEPRWPRLDYAVATAANTLRGFDLRRVMVLLGTGPGAVPSLAPLAEAVPDVDLVVVGVNDPATVSAWRASARAAGIHAVVLDDAQTRLNLASYVTGEPIK